MASSEHGCLRGCAARDRARRRASAPADGSKRAASIDEAQSGGGGQIDASPAFRQSLSRPRRFLGGVCFTLTPRAAPQWASWTKPPRPPRSSSRKWMPSVKQGRGRIGLKSPCTSSNRLPWLWPYPWRQSATKLTLCFAGPSKCWRLGVCFPGEHSRLQSPLHREAFPRRVLPAGRRSQWDLIPVRGGESATFPQFSEMDRAIAQRVG